MRLETARSWSRGGSKPARPSHTAHAPQILGEILSRRLPFVRPRKDSHGGNLLLVVVLIVHVVARLPRRRRRRRVRYQANERRSRRVRQVPLQLRRQDPAPPR
uniref:Uncharacterized protein n=1 Tax=Oryza punctata TaxID=4537 RepID=A0A0E0MF58_ORYPU